MYVMLFGVLGCKYFTTVYRNKISNVLCRLALVTVRTYVSLDIALGIGMFFFIKMYRTP